MATRTELELKLLSRLKQYDPAGLTEIQLLQRVYAHDYALSEYITTPVGNKMTIIQMDPLLLALMGRDETIPL